MSIKIFFLVLLTVPCRLCSQQKIHIIPQPLHVVEVDGSFIIDNNISLLFNRSDKGLSAAAAFFISTVKNISGHTLSLKASNKKTIQLSLKKIKQIGDEGYQLHVFRERIEINANTKAGIVYGMQSLFQLLPRIRTNAVLSIPCMRITDYPRFRWRGMHLDVSRHFFSPEVIKQFIDLMALYKFNIFHWHLCDAQGWRLEIKRYPKLTSVGAWRPDRWGINWREVESSKNEEPVSYGGYYTQQQVKEIVSYASTRNITIVPEIEMPGHSAAALAAYPELSCTRQPQRVPTGRVPAGVENNYCAGNDSVFSFLENVLTEVMQLFPSTYIHVGGDEVNKSSWINCARCQSLKLKMGLKDENELQSYFIRRIEKFLTAHQRKLIGWDEILEGGLAPQATVMCWRGERGGIQAAQMHHDVVMTPANPLYFDYYQAGPEGEPPAIGGLNTLKMVYDYSPVPEKLNAGEAKYILGAQANIWSEFIPTVQQLQYMALPRMLALSEVLWSVKENKNWEYFYQRLQKQFKDLEQLGINYCKGNLKVAVKPVFHEGRITVSLSSEIPQAQIYYTTDGSTPDTGSYEYKTPVPINASLTLKAVTVLNGKVVTAIPAEQAFVLHKAIGKNGKADLLTDGIRGLAAGNKYWQKIAGSDLMATIDLGEEKNIQTIAIGCLQNYNGGVFLPQSVQFEIARDAKKFVSIQTLINPVSFKQINTTHEFRVHFPATAAQFIRITAKNNICPPGHKNAGKSASIMADEIVVE